MNEKTAWKTPSQDEAYAFAFTECGETVDAYLRWIGGFARNNHRAPTIVEELADTGMMVMTGLGKSHQYNERVEDVERADVTLIGSLKIICKMVLRAWACLDDEWLDNEIFAEWALSEIVGLMRYLEADFETELGKRMARIEQKNLIAEMPQ